MVKKKRVAHALAEVRLVLLKQHDGTLSTACLQNFTMRGLVRVEPKGKQAPDPQVSYIYKNMHVAWHVTACT